MRFVDCESVGLAPILALDVAEAWVAIAPTNAAEEKASRKAMRMAYSRPRNWPSLRRGRELAPLLFGYLSTQETVKLMLTERASPADMEIGEGKLVEGMLSNGLRSAFPPCTLVPDCTSFNGQSLVHVPSADARTVDPKLAEATHPRHVSSVSHPCGHTALVEAAATPQPALTLPQDPIATPISAVRD